MFNQTFGKRMELKQLNADKSMLINTNDLLMATSCDHALLMSLKSSIEKLESNVLVDIPSQMKNDQTVVAIELIEKRLQSIESKITDVNKNKLATDKKIKFLFDKLNTLENLSASIFEQ